MPRSTKGLYKRGKTWWMNYFDCLGIQRWESSKLTDKKLAEALLAQRYEEARSGIVSDPPIKPLALVDLKTRYLEVVGHQRGIATKKIHFAHFARIWGNPPIHSLTVDVIDQYRTRRLREGVIGSTINKEISTLKNALTKAVEWRLLRKSFRESLTAIKKFQEPDGRLRYLANQAEAERLLDACEPWLKPIVTIALHTGMRKGEVLGLTWDRVNMINGNLRLKHTKNGRSRAIPFNGTVWAEFIDLSKQKNGPYVFHDEAGRRYNDCHHGFDRATKKAGIHDFTFHDLRHSFASWLAMKGIPINTIGELLGHKNPAQTLRYAHLSPTYLISAVRTLDGVQEPAFGLKRDSQPDKNLTIWPELTLEPEAHSDADQESETLKPLDRSGESVRNGGGAEAGI